jgi:hypothetical protein
VKFIIRPKWCRNAGRMSTRVEARRSWFIAGYSPSSC